MKSEMLMDLLIVKTTEGKEVTVQLAKGLHQEDLRRHGQEDQNHQNITNI